MRKVEKVSVLCLHGGRYESNNIEHAVDYIYDHKIGGMRYEIEKFEVIVIFNNGDKIEGNFSRKYDAVDFLKNHS